MLASVAQITFAQQNMGSQSVRVSGFELLQESGQITIDFTLDMGNKAARRANTLTIIPVLTNGTQKLELTPVIVRGKRAQIIYKRRFIASSQSIEILDNTNAIVTSNGKKVKYHAVIPFADWMPGSVLLLDGIDEGCCTAVKTNLGLIADNLIVPENELLIRERPVQVQSPVSVGDRIAHTLPFVKPMSEYRPFDEYSRDGTITVYFRQGKYDIDRNYRGNNASLTDILSVIREIEASGNSNIEQIVIAGFASPEGNTNSNYRLSENRAEGVRKYILNNSSINPDRLNVYVGGEDWVGLKLMVEASNMREKQAILNIINSNSGSNDARLNRLMQLNGGETYRYLLNNIFPELRNASYITIYYKNK